MTDTDAQDEVIRDEDGTLYSHARLAQARPKFPHLENLDRVPHVVTLDVTITEKIHGFNARFGRDPDDVEWVGSRNNDYDLDDSAPELQGFTKVARSLVDRVPSGITVYGEWAGKGIQKGIDYGAPHFRLFAIRRLGEPVSSSKETIESYADLIGCFAVPIIAEGRALPTSDLDALRRAPSLVSPDEREGIVLAPVYAAYDSHGHQLIAKLKNPTFEERSHARREPRLAVDLTTALAFAAEYVTDERLGHVLDQVSEAAGDGSDPLDRQHIGSVLRTMYQDVVREGADDFARLGDAEKTVGKVVNDLTKALLEVRRSRALAEAEA